MIKLTLLILIATSSLAATFEFIGPCTNNPLLRVEVEVGANETVGSATIKTLDQFKISYKGTQRGMNSIFDTPTGLDAMEVLSDTEMNAHGWCYSINGVSPEVYPDEVKIEDDAHILWWFGYASYVRGEWITQCSPTWKRAPEQFCKN